jgi:hypothetical protein
MDRFALGSNLWRNDEFMNSLDLKWFEKIEKLEEFIVNASKGGWEVKVSFGSVNEPLKIKISRRASHKMDSSRSKNILRNWRRPDSI